MDNTITQGFLYASATGIIAELDSTGTVVSRFVYGMRAHVPDYLVKGGATFPCPRPFRRLPPEAPRARQSKRPGFLSFILLPSQILCTTPCYWRGPLQERSQMYSTTLFGRL